MAKKQTLYPHVPTGGKELPSVSGTPLSPENIYYFVPTVDYSGGIAFVWARDKATARLLANELRPSAGLELKGTLKDLISQIGRYKLVSFVTME